MVWLLNPNHIDAYIFAGSIRHCLSRRDREYHMQRKHERRKQQRAKSLIGRITGWKLLNGVG